MRELIRRTKDAKGENPDLLFVVNEAVIRCLDRRGIKYHYACQSRLTFDRFRDAMADFAAQLMTPRCD
jgi:hypothetical protein